MKISIIAAFSSNYVIGDDNKLLWHIPEDLKRFKTLTTGHPIIMGRKTWDSIGRPLPGRMNVVISRNPEWQAPAGTVGAASLSEALVKAEAQAELEGGDEVMIIGGGTIYQAFLPHAQRLYLTHIDLSVEGDTQFPDYEQQAHWQEISKESFAKDEKNAHNLQFVTLQRVPD